MAESHGYKGDLTFSTCSYVLPVVLSSASHSVRHSKSYADHMPAGSNEGKLSRICAKMGDYILDLCRVMKQACRLECLCF
jgi:hypothetical protein